MKEEGSAGRPTPLRDIVPSGEPSVFSARGTDPQMLWVPNLQQRAALDRRPAVRVTVRMHATAGRLTEPCCYFDWGDGFSDEVRKPLSVVEPGIYAAVAHSNAGALRRIRFDPSTEACRFELSDFQVEPAASALSQTPRLSAFRRLARRALRRLPDNVQGRLRAVYGLVARASGENFRALAKRSVAGGARWRKAYTHQFNVARNLRSPHFAAPPLMPPPRDPESPKVIAFYLPQFHPFPENDAWWGKGFTEWSNVSKAVPQFSGHLQPRLPADFGYYDLRVPEVRHAQCDLARRTGVDAFCFHYYWFNGKRVLERPLDDFVNDASLDFPFALCWANENWTRRWDGQESDVLLGQRHSPEDDLAAFDDLARYMRSPRYLTVDDKPVLLLYRPDILPDAAATLKRWRTEARRLGLGELFLLCTDAFGFADYREYGFDGIVEFPPHALAMGEITDRIERLNPGFRGRVYDYGTVVAAKVQDLAEVRDPRRFPGVMPAWDNEARKPGAGHVFHGASPETFHLWIGAALDSTTRNSPPGERMVFVNAWNEWAEGAYLEPDRWFGYGFAQAVRSALEARAPRLAEADLSTMRPAAVRRHSAVVLLHLYYPELIEAFARHLEPLADHVDVAVTFPALWSADDLERLKHAFPSAWLMPVANRGRDVAPFLDALSWARDMGYDVFCKLHSKRSPHTTDGDAWRERLLAPLLAPSAVPDILNRFATNPKLGFLAPTSSRRRLGEPDVMFNNRATFDRLGKQFGFAYDDAMSFPAGTMFWGRVRGFEPLADARGGLNFETELGRIDGTLAHALERTMAAIPEAAGYQACWDI